MIVYGDVFSGNCYKIKLTCHLLNIPYEWRHVDILNKETHTPDFLQINPNGKIPSVVLDDNRVLWESNAILYWVAQGSHLLPSNPWLIAQILQWQFFEQYSHEPYIATSRYIQKYLQLPENRRYEYESKRAGGYKALGVMENHLKHNDFFVHNRYTIADISLFAYTHVADEGGFSLDQYPAVRAWIQRIKQEPNHILMED